MVLSALVVTLSDDDEERECALALLSADPRIAMGDAEGARVPVVLETSTAREGAQLAEALLDVDGVRLVDLVLADFSDEEH
jgi:hypothetical protein